MQNTLAWGTRVLDGTFYSPVPDAAFSIVDARDVAEVAAVALTEDGHEGKAYGLSGPEAVSYRDQATRLFKAAGRDIEVEEIPVETLKRELVRAGVPPWNAEGLKELFEVYASGGAQMVTSGVKDVLDRDPRDIDAFAADHVDSFKEKVRAPGAPASRHTPTTRSSRSSIPRRSSEDRASRWSSRRSPTSCAAPARRRSSRASKICNSRRRTPPTPICACTCSATAW